MTVIFIFAVEDNNVVAVSEVTDEDDLAKLQKLSGKVWQNVSAFEAGMFHLEIDLEEEAGLLERAQSNSQDMEMQLDQIPEEHSPTKFKKGDSDKKKIEKLEKELKRMHSARHSDAKHNRNIIQSLQNTITRNKAVIEQLKSSGAGKSSEKVNNCTLLLYLSHNIFVL